MRDKKQIKINLKRATLILLICIAMITLFMLIYTKTNFVADPVVPTDSEDYKAITINGKIYYQRLSKNTWDGQYHQEKFYTSNSTDNIMEVVSYTEYLENVNLINDTASNKIEEYYTNKDSNYIILSHANGYSWCGMELIDCFEEDNKIIIYGDEYTEGVMADGSGFFIAIPTNMPVGTEIEYRECYTSSEIDNLKKSGTPLNQSDITVYKPIIYLYPTKDIELSVKLGYEDKITCSYPRYTMGWNVFAKTSGNLIDLNTNRALYALYYESTAVCNFKIRKDGFIVRGSDIIEFLEEKLAILGLTEREMEEFIVYWLPELQKNEYNYIRFATKEEINQNMPLEFSIQPDTLIRVLMTYKKIDKPIDVEEQQLETPERTGFVAVEWGGTEIE